MKYLISFVLLTTVVLLASCTTPESKVESNIKIYTHVWDEILNKGKIEMFNENNFTKGVILHANPHDLVGIDSMKAYYKNFLTGFSNIEFTIKGIIGHDVNIVKYWNFKGTHTGTFFGIPATGKTVNIEGATLVRMDNGKIAEERDFYDNLDFLQQLGVIAQ